MKNTTFNNYLKIGEKYVITTNYQKIKDLVQDGFITVVKSDKVK